MRGEHGLWYHRGKTYGSLGDALRAEERARLTAAIVRMLGLLPEARLRQLYHLVLHLR